MEILNFVRKNIGIVSALSCGEMKFFLCVLLLLKEVHTIGCLQDFPKF